jgi:prepilin-type N-terminal cleavage/methylation domain-containing protein
MEFNKRKTDYRLLITDYCFGFTLVELLIVIAIMGVMTTVSVVSFQAQARKGRDARRQAELKQYQAALEVYANSNLNLYVAGSGSASGFCGTLGMSNCPNDPLNSGTNTYTYCASADRTIYKLYTALEMPTTPLTYWVVCSNGSSGAVIVAPGGSCGSATCP